MRQYATPGLVVLNRSTGETFSATQGDYFMYRDDEPMHGADEEPLILALTIREHSKPLQPLTS